MTKDEALKLALEALESTLSDNQPYIVKCGKAITAIKEALAEHAMRETQRLGQEIEQEPVAWMSEHDVGFRKSEFGATPTVPLYTTPPQRTEQLKACVYCGQLVAKEKNT